MKKALVTLIATLALAVGTAHAVIYDSSIVIPDANVLINFNNSGLDWVYAGPLSPHAWSVEQIYTPSYRAVEGWRYATVAEWAKRPAWSDFIVPGHAVSLANNFTDHTCYIFASEYWSTFNSVDLLDASNGYLTNGNGLGYADTGADTFYVRDSHAASHFAPVPEPSTSILLGAGIAGVVLLRRRNK